MSKLTVWVKDNGQEIDVNDHPDNAAHARKMGWLPKSEKTKQAKEAKLAEDAKKAEEAKLAEDAKKAEGAK